MSTIDSIAEVIDYVYNSLDKRESFISIYLDLAQLLYLINFKNGYKTTLILCIQKN